MHHNRWGLQESPFRGHRDSNSFYRGPTHEEALARLDFLATEGRRLGLLVGPSGSGKSLLLDIFAAELRRRVPQVARLSLFDVEPDEWLWQLAAAWGLNPSATDSAVTLWRLIDDRLRECRSLDWQAAVLLDDADQADPQVLRHVARLAMFDHSSNMRLTIILAGRKEGMSRLDPSLVELATLRIELEPWERDETQEYVRSMLSRAGRPASAFAPPAVDRLHELSHGIPRRISQLADLALLAGAGQRLDHIDADVVETVYQELGVGV